MLNIIVVNVGLISKTYNETKIVTALHREKIWNLAINEI